MAASMFKPVVYKYTLALLAKVSVDYNLPVDELAAKYLSDCAPAPTKPKVLKPKVPKVPMEERPICPALTGKKKQPCKNKCMPGGTACSRHSEKPIPPAEPAPGAEVCVPCVPALTVPPVKTKKTVLKKTPVVAPAPTPVVVAPVPVPVPAAVSIEERLKLLMANSAGDEGEDTEEEDEDEEEEPESPGMLIHRAKMAELGRTVEYEDDDEEDDEDDMEEEELEE